MLLFLEKISDFHLAKFLMTFFLILFRKIYYSPYFQKFPPCFRIIRQLFTYFMCISFPPYFDHDAFMHHPMHALDAPGGSAIFNSAMTIGLATGVIY